MPAEENEPLASPTREEEEPTETSPLLNRSDDGNHDDDSESEQNGRASNEPQSRAAWSLWSICNKKTSTKAPWRWPSIIAMALLGIIVILIIILGFLVPPAVKEYAEKAAVLEPTNLSIENITSYGIRARIRANVYLDGSRVDNQNSRRIGKAVTGIMRKLETKETTVNVYLPEYADALAGTAVIPPLVVDVVNGHTNELDFVADVNPGDAEHIRKIANDWLEGNLKQLKVVGKTKVHLKSGIIPLGAHDVAESMVFEANDIPSMPNYSIERMDLHDRPVDGHGRKVIEADVSLKVHNDYPVSFRVPTLGFEVLVPNCDSSLPSISVADAVTEPIDVRAKADVQADAKGIIRDIPESLTKACPHSESSPLDHFMDRYLHGEDAKVFVRGKKTNNTDTPEWISDILESITVPVDFPGRSFDSLIRKFSLTDVDFKLPDPFADVDDPEGEPRVSGTAQVLAAVPPELNVDLGVDKLRSNADLFYKKRKMGELNLRHWQSANSTKIQDNENGETLLNITSRLVDVPLTITDGDVFSEVMQKLLFGGGDITLDIKAEVDVKLKTVLGILTVKKVPAEGKIPVNGFPGNALGKLKPQVGEIEVMETTETGILMRALVNLTNPTPYAAVVPYLSVHILHDGELLGEAISRNVTFDLGNNTNLPVLATWDPLRFGGEEAQAVGRKLLSDYVSGKNTTLTARTHKRSVPNVPIIGEALSKINITLPTPRITVPGEDEHGDEKPHFIADATFHLFSSTATFTLLSPLLYNTLYIEHINATALYNHTEPVGQIIHDEPFPATPGRSQTPRLPVIWSASSVGYGKLKEALGGSLKLDAIANVTVRLGSWTEKIHYTGKGIGAKVSL
ncbi:uncharacterized protein FFB20_14567 [Fusarium fujikuroi]|uniref:Pre-rRNA processing protein n=1 Tax=Gibberella fujikuroi (strain CBS 195.34 / IMI 58289 / NRRL A-6831) TaxID=1279085 RepID=S0DXQ1_GIBF5|nr:uncharacterized protein FFUJ_13513 [Fusarium fujikuroi IMI 58289]KLP07539.1 uncharacterized protein Y057_8914 [Fusarium fujikuroi]KLP18740.1 uncharacterized protein LW94_5794 [Fusarium fujikuroi]QGI63349.1 hypothetical protein CEK27_007320 [Fusarium fujikuroi]QGI80627.1 hypothetical protein CEK25_007356 [Fusarium fujikuroi]QGI94231.1 hypothetical protein CEK26_007300 [Fusarium fujikuroi]